MPNIDNIIDYENGELDFVETIELFSDLVKKGTINHLQGSYGSTACHLVEEGLLESDGTIDWDRVDHAEAYGL
tara:strand:- start:1901 stop:2119 length:219 start_codon:yes stop_codon:yes gene_type:complete